MWSYHVYSVSLLGPSVSACSMIHLPLYRLAGFPPFWHRKQLVLLRNIMEGRYEFVSPEWDDISDSAKDLVSKICRQCLLF